MLGFGQIGFLALGQLPRNSVQGALSPDWGRPLAKKLTVAVVATTVVGFVAPPPAQAARVFTRFSEPAPRNKILPGFTNAPLQRFAQPYVFGQFSQPQFGRTIIQDEQPSALFEVEPPQLPPFTAFARFEGVLRAKYNVALFSGLTAAPFIPLVDTHDGGWVKRKRRRSGLDPIEIELAEKASRRSALELAIYGPQVEYTNPAPVFEPTPAVPANVADLARIVFSIQAEHLRVARSQAEQDDEDELEAILREIL